MMKLRIFHEKRSMFVPTLRNGITDLDIVDYKETLVINPLEVNSWKQLDGEKHISIKMRSGETINLSSISLEDFTSWMEEALAQIPTEGTPTLPLHPSQIIGL